MSPASIVVVLAVCILCAFSFLDDPDVPFWVRFLMAVLGGIGAVLAALQFPPLL